MSDEVEVRCDDREALLATRDLPDDTRVYVVHVCEHPFAHIEQMEREDGAW